MLSRNIGGVLSRTTKAPQDEILRNNTMGVITDGQKLFTKGIFGIIPRASIPYKKGSVGATGLLQL